MKQIHPESSEPSASSYKSNRSRSRLTRHYYVWCGQDYKCNQALPLGVTLIASFHRYTGSLNSMFVGPEGLLFTGCNPTIIERWDKGTLIGGFNAQSGPINAIIAGPNGHIISSHYDGNIKVWKRCRPKPPYYDQVVTLPTQRDLIVSMFRRLKYNFWSLYDTPISCLCLSENMKFVYSGSCDCTVKVWRLTDWRLAELIKGHTKKVNAIATGSSGLVFSASADGSIRMFRRVEDTRKDFPKNQFVSVLSKGNVVNALLFKYTEDSKGELYAGLEDGTLRFWEEKGWRHPMTMSYHKKAVTCVAGLSGRPLFFSGSLDGKISVWCREQHNHKLLMVLTLHQGSVNCLAVQNDWDEINDGPQRCILYSNAQDERIKIWRVAEVTNMNYIMHN